MISRIVLAAAVISLGVIPALAWDCPNASKTVMGFYEKTVKKTGVNQAKLTQAKKLIEEGDQAHKDGKHREALDKLADATKLITSATP